jgi:hypothetical protein
MSKKQSKVVKKKSFSFIFAKHISSRLVGCAVEIVSGDIFGVCNTVEADMKEY